MRNVVEHLLHTALGDSRGEILPEEREGFGHYTTAVAMQIGKERGENPVAVAENLAEKMKQAAPAGLIEKIEVAGPGFINIWLTVSALQKEFTRIVKDADFGNADALKGKRVMIEYTDPNPFKEFHIGHVMTNTIGESLARLHEAAGAEVLRVNYQGDVGLHVAKSVWGMTHLENEIPSEDASPADKSKFLGRAYALGSKAYTEDVSAKTDIDSLNKKIYEKSDADVVAMYDKGKRWSLEYFETLYVRLGTKFVHYFFESEVAPEGTRIVKAHPDIFVESEGAIIFRGEEHDLHNRVFINALGLPTYEAKELGLNKIKFDTYSPDTSIIVTGNEINEYFKVLLKAMSLVLPEVAKKTTHLGHGMLRLPTGKMSSRTGDVITAEWLIDEIKKAVGDKIKEREFTAEESERIKECVAIAAIRYSILRQGIGKDIIFDIEKSIAFQGESGPYLQYTYARLRRMIVKSGEQSDLLANHASLLTTQHELRLMRKLFEFSDEIKKSVAETMTHNLAKYLYEVANLANRFYEDQQILTDENTARRSARLILAATAARVLARGLALLGIEALESI